jgi:hypothetical protein
MKPFAIALFSAAVLLSGCTAAPQPPATPTPVASPSASAITLELDPSQRSATKVVLADSAAIFHDNGASGPASFAVSGDHVWLANPSLYGWGSAHPYGYLDCYVGGKRVGRTKLPGHLAKDLLVRQGKAYLFERALSAPGYERVVSYQIEGTSLTSPKILKANYLAGDDLMLRFDGDTLVTVGTDGATDIIDGPGPAQPTAQFVLAEHSVTIPAQGSVPRITVQVKGDASAQQVGLDGQYVYYLISDVVTSGNKDKGYVYLTTSWVYRFSLDGAGTPQAYRVVDPGQFPTRSIAVDNGGVYQLTSNTKVAKVILIQPAS